MFRARNYRRTAALVTVVAWCVGLTTLGSAEDAPIKMYPPHSVVHGKTIGEWGANWWQWVISIPKGTNPVRDDRTGEFCHSVPEGPVFFLYGNFGGIDLRTCTIESGKEVLVPIFNYLDYNIPPENLTLEELILEAAKVIDLGSLIGLTVDGVEVPQETLFQHREAFAGFTFVIPENNVFDEPPGTFEPAASDGYYVMLEPLAVGTHEIRTHSIVGDWDSDPETPICTACDDSSCAFCLDVTYILTVVPARFRRGDANGDGGSNITDPVGILEWLFRGGAPPACHDGADADDNSTIDLADAVFLLNWLFRGSMAPPAPGPETCGPDPTEDSIVACAKACGD